jgi:DNA primase
MSTVFETIKDRLPITEVLSSYITVQPNGSQYKAKCPFHNERTASFYISPERGLYYCFGCGAKGDIFTFVEQFEGLDKKGALKLLAERAGVVLQGSTGAYSDTDGVYEALEKATVLYEQLLEKTDPAKAYLDSRGVTKETIASFRIGYAPDEWRTVESLAKNQEEKSFALRAGLTKRTEDLPAQPGKVYDRFRKRIMFPLMDGSGRVIGFSGRSFPEDENSPKYLNSPETEVFQKSKTLFGFDKAKFHIKKHNFAILVEGQMDLVISHQAGFKNTVASSGTAVSEDAARDPFSNLSVLSRLSPHIFLAFDGDLAGQKAMDRAALVALSLGMNPKVVVLPLGVDPADYIQKEGADAWKERLKESKHFIEHHLGLIKRESQSPHLFVKTIKEKLFPFLARVASPMEKSLYISRIAEEVNMSPSVISEELKKVTPTAVEEKLNPVTSKKSSDGTAYERLTAMRKVFPGETIEKVAEKLNSLSVGDTIFSAPPLQEEQLERVSIVVEREYGSLSEVDKESVTKELVEKIIKEFLISTQQTYTTELKEAERNGLEEEILRISTILKEIAQRRHEPM